MGTLHLTLGEYVKRLRRDRRWPLHQLAQTSGLSYTHLSRIENDSTVPRPDTVARIATALDGDLKLMLELSGSLPRAIMDRIESRSSRPGTGLKRRAGAGSAPDRRLGSLQEATVELGQAKGLTVEEAQAIAAAIEHLIELDEHQRSAVLDLVRSLSADG